ncbi:MAG: hypothetical protein Q8Q20_03680 [bacterium]|nr:hypothetical protein [bacterium]
MTMKTPFEKNESPQENDDEEEITEEHIEEEETVIEDILGVPEKWKWFSMDNPVTYVIIVLLLGAIAYVVWRLTGFNIT